MEYETGALLDPGISACAATPHDHVASFTPLDESA